MKIYFKLLRKLDKFSSRLNCWCQSKRKELASRTFERKGRKPWTEGYDQARIQFQEEVLSSTELMALFREMQHGSLPNGYGYGLDERCVEVPWALSRLSSEDYRVLDAGSALNHPYILGQPVWNNKKLDIMTLAPEPICEWQKGISYLFGDLRETPYRDGLFDAISSVSTLEHIGMNNEAFSKDSVHREENLDDVFLALKELRRLLKPGGRLIFTVPYGVYENHGIFQQFDSKLLEACASAFNPAQRNEAFFLYSETGWQLVSQGMCSNAHYALTRWSPSGFEGNDTAAAARCVACCEWVI